MDKIKIFNIIRTDIDPITDEYAGKTIIRRYYTEEEAIDFVKKWQKQWDEEEERGHRPDFAMERYLDIDEQVFYIRTPEDKEEEIFIYTED